MHNCTLLAFKSLSGGDTEVRVLYPRVTLARRKCAWHLKFEASSVVPTWNIITSFSGVNFHHCQFCPTLLSAYINISIAVMDFG